MTVSNGCLCIYIAVWGRVEAASEQLDDLLHILLLHREGDWLRRFYLLQKNQTWHTHVGSQSLKRSIFLAQSKKAILKSLTFKNGTCDATYYAHYATLLRIHLRWQGGQLWIARFAGDRPTNTFFNHHNRPSEVYLLRLKMSLTICFQLRKFWYDNINFLRRKQPKTVRGGLQKKSSCAFGFCPNGGGGPAQIFCPPFTNCIYWVNLGRGREGKTPAQIFWYIGVKKSGTSFPN